MRWTKERVEQLRTLAAKGWTMAQAANTMGTTLSAVIKAAARNEIRFPYKPRGQRRPAYDDLAAHWATIIIGPMRVALRAECERIMAGG